MLADISLGLQALARALRLLRQPGVRRYVIIPLLINLILFGALVWYGYGLFAGMLGWLMSLAFVEWLISLVPAISVIIEGLFWLFFGLLAAVMVFFAFTPVANIIAAPFNALMSEKIEAHLTGRAPQSETGFAQMAVDAIGSQLRKLAYIALWALGLFLVTLIPLVNLVAPLLWIVFGSWLLSLEYFDYPMGNHDLVFAEQKKRLKQRRGVSLGFGGGVMVMTSIPVVNFFAMPVAVAGATLLWVEHFHKADSGALKAAS